jgi:hypothetical protein
MVEEMGLPLYTAQLIPVCPSHHTLARIKRRLLADMLVSVMQYIQRDGVQCLALMVEYDKRSGINKIVKILIYAARDGNNR